MEKEQRLIDANKIEPIDFPSHEMDGLDVVRYLSTLPTVDAVEVVRCKDCKYRGTDWCIFHVKGEPAAEELLKKLDNDFCSCGERRNDGSEG